jgi:hypothetical protein
MNDCLCQKTSCGCAANPSTCDCGESCGCQASCDCGDECDCAGDAD